MFYVSNPPPTGCGTAAGFGALATTALNRLRSRNHYHSRGRVDAANEEKEPSYRSASYNNIAPNGNVRRPGLSREGELNGSSGGGCVAGGGGERTERGAARKVHVPSPGFQGFPPAKRARARASERE